MAAASTHTYAVEAVDAKGVTSAAKDLLLVEDHGDPALDGPNAKGFQYGWDAYTVSGAPQS